MGSMHWTDEESRYLKAIFTWQDRSNEAKAAARRRAAAQAKKLTVGEFRVLVIGGQGTGKTSLLTRFCDGSFRGESEPADPFYERGCRHLVEIDGQNYMVDALEMPSRHLSSNPMLEQALNITEAAVLVYDVRDPSSLQLARSIHDFIRDSIAGSGGDRTKRDYGLLLVGNKSDVDDGSSSSSSSSNSNDNNNNIDSSNSKNNDSSNDNGNNNDVDNDNNNNNNNGGSEEEDGEEQDDEHPPPPQQLPPQRQVSRAEGSATAASFAMSCLFLEASAKSGAGVGDIFPVLGREMLRARAQRAQRRRDEAEAQLQLQLQRAKSQKSTATATANNNNNKRRPGLWKTLRTPFARTRRYTNETA